METTDETIADDPSKWDTSDLRQWRRDGRPTNVTIQPGTNAPAATTNTATTTAQDKQQKIDDDMLMSWKRLRKDP